MHMLACVRIVMTMHKHMHTTCISTGCMSLCVLVPFRVLQLKIIYLHAIGAIRMLRNADWGGGGGSYFLKKNVTKV